MPLASGLLSVSLLLGWLPYESVAGALYVLRVRPFDSTHVGPWWCPTPPRRASSAR